MHLREATAKFASAGFDPLVAVIAEVSSLLVFRFGLLKTTTHSLHGKAALRNWAWAV